MPFYGLNGLDLILLVVFFYVSYKLYKRAKKESEDKKQWLKPKKKNLSATTDIVSVMVRPHTIMKKRGFSD